MHLTFEQSQVLAASAAKVFQPRIPITAKELFAGRWTELTAIADAVNQPGLHVLIYGERGVGKTSLANIVRPSIRALDVYGKQEGEVPERLVVKANANSGDTFSDIWAKLFGDLTWQDDRPAIGLPPSKRERTSIGEAFSLPGKLGVDHVRRVLSNMSGSVFIVDEFDRAAQETSRDFTDLIKSLSDFAVDCTVVLVGVSDTVDKLVADHASINRAVVQIFLPRMKPKELMEILTNAEKSLSISFSSEAANLIVHVSQGLPHYTHLIGLHAVRTAVSRRYSNEIERPDVFEGLKEAVKQAQQSVTEKHSKATHKLTKHFHVAVPLSLGACPLIPPHLRCRAVGIPIWSWPPLTCAKQTAYHFTLDN